MKTIELTHANYKVPICVQTAQIFYFYFSDAEKATRVVSSGGSFVPVINSVEEINKIINKEN